MGRVANELKGDLERLDTPSGIGPDSRWWANTWWANMPLNEGSQKRLHSAVT